MTLRFTISPHRNEVVRVYRRQSMRTKPSVDRFEQANRCEPVQVLQMRRGHQGAQSLDTPQFEALPERRLDGAEAVIVHVKSDALNYPLAWFAQTTKCGSRLPL